MLEADTGTVDMVRSSSQHFGGDGGERSKSCREGLEKMHGSQEA